MRERNARSLDRAEAERRRAEEERDRFFNLSLDMLCVAAFDGYFKQLNPAWETTLGWTKEELLAKPYLEFVHPDDRESTITEAKKLSTGGVTIIFENRYLCRDGSYKWLQWNAIPFLEQQLIYAAARDVTERKQMEEKLKSYSVQLEAANKEMEAFSYSVSHDLRAPLRHVDGFSQVLLEEHADKLNEKGKDHLQRVRAAAQRMSELIEDMLRLSRVTRAEMKHERVDLSGLARKIVLELQKAQPERRVDFTITPGLVVEGDGRLLRVMLENLLGNAWKFTRKRSNAEIKFGMVQHEGLKAYFVRDNGAGFEMDYAGKLFAPFQRLHTAEEFPGTGIGLATVQRIIHRHGGRVWAEGDVGKGATFYFTIPLQAGA